MKHVKIMRYHGIEPYFVFDGGLLPAKESTEDARKRNRKIALDKAHEFEKAGDTKKAGDYYARSIDVSPQMAYQVIKASTIFN